MKHIFRSDNKKARIVRLGDAIGDNKAASRYKCHPNLIPKWREKMVAGNSQAAIVKTPTSKKLRGVVAPSYGMISESMIERVLEKVIRETLLG